MSNVISTAVSKTLNVVLAQGSAVFNNTDNSITLAGIGKDIEIGDVIQVIGAPSNSKEFTIEEITSSGKVIVNKAHAGGTTNKALVSETATVTVKLLCKWYLAPIGLGQGWVDVTAERLAGEQYSGVTNRAINVSLVVLTPDFSVDVDGVLSAGGRLTATNTARGGTSFTTPPNAIYEVGLGATSGLIVSWSELR